MQELQNAERSKWGAPPRALLPHAVRWTLKSTVAGELVLLGTPATPATPALLSPCLPSNLPALQPEVRLGIFEADPADQAAEKPLVVRDLAPFHFRTQ